MQNVMVDLETMGRGHRAAIVAIGAVKFDFNTGLLGNSFYETVDLESAQNCGQSIDASTVLWWMQQPLEARQEIISCNRMPLTRALRAFASYLAKDEPEDGSCIWGHGATFDCRILRDAYELIFAGDSPPWSYRHDRDTRTLLELPEILDLKVKEIAFEGIKHHALFDARHTARCLCAAFDAVGGITR